MSAKKHHQHLRREIILLFVIKGCLLALLWLICFSPSHEVPVNANLMQQQLLHST